MGAVAVGALAAGTVFSAFSQKESGKAQSSLLKQNATIAGYQAQDAIAQGEEDVKLIRQAVRATIGKQRAMAASGGFLVNKGTNLELQADAAYQGELDVARARFNARRKAWGYLTQNASYMYQADLAKQSGKYNFYGSLLQGAGNVYGTGYQLGYWGQSGGAA